MNVGGIPGQTYPFGFLIATLGILLLMLLLFLFLNYMKWL